MNGKLLFATVRTKTTLMGLSILLCVDVIYILFRQQTEFARFWQRKNQKHLMRMLDNYKSTSPLSSEACKYKFDTNSKRQF